MVGARRQFHDATRVRDPYLGVEMVAKSCPKCDYEIQGRASNEDTLVSIYDDHYEREHVHTRRARVTVEIAVPDAGREFDDERARKLAKETVDRGFSNSEEGVVDVELIHERNEGGDA